MHKTLRVTPCIANQINSYGYDVGRHWKPYGQVLDLMIWCFYVFLRFKCISHTIYLGAKQHYGMTRILNDLSEWFKKNLPFILLLIFTITYIFSIWGNVEDQKWKEFLTGISKVGIGSALFTFLVKWLQFSGVIKDEITKFIFEPRFLSNRKDLPQFWENVSQELFKNRFPNISQKLLKDIREKYMPIDHPMYYDDAEHVIEITLTDRENGWASVRQSIKLNAITSDKRASHKYEFGNIMKYRGVRDANTEYSVSLVKINQKNITGSELVGHTYSEDKKENSFKNHFVITLTGSDKYIIEREEIKKYNLYFDNILYFYANRMYNKLKVEIHYPKDELDVELCKGGTLNNFEINNHTKNSTRYYCNGMIYPEQGYYINVKKK